MNKKNIFRLLMIFICISVGAYCLRGEVFPGSFDVENTTHKIIFDRMQDFSGATLVNLDSTPEEEIFIAGFGSSNLMLKRSQDKFFPLAIPELEDPYGMTFAVSACDLDGDGRDEILLLNRPKDGSDLSRPRILKYSQDRWGDILDPKSLVVEDIKMGYAATCIDRKGDRKYGLAVTNENGKIAYLEVVDAQLKNIASEIGLGLSSRGRSVMGVPNMFGRVNIFVGNEDGANFFFINKGDGTFINKADESNLSDEKFDARGISLIDSNHDEIPDLVYGNHYGPLRLMEQTREEKFVNVATEEMGQSYAVNAPVSGDFNLDGYEDIYLNNIRGDNKVFARFKKTWFELPIDVLKEKEMFGISTLAGDLDNNGSYDILNNHGDGSKFPVTFYSIRPVHPWIKFSVRYANGGIPRGAVLRLRTNMNDKLLFISSGSGRFANYDPIVTASVERGEEVRVLEVILPSGKRLEFKKNFTTMTTHDLIIR